jgi:hypothetical protein
LRRTSCGDRRIDIGRITLGDMRKQLTGSGLARFEALTRGWRAPSTAYEMAEAGIVLREPGTRGLIVLGCGTVLH